METKVDSHWLNRWGMPVAVICVAGLLCASLYFPKHNGIAERSPGTRALNDIKQLLLGCRAYAVDHEGKYPPNLKALYPDYIDHLAIFEGLNHEFTKKQPMTYFPGLTDTSDPKAPLIEHPFTFKGRKITGYAGGEVTVEEPKTK